MGTERAAVPPEDIPACAYGATALRRFARAEVRVRLLDGTTWSGRLRTELLTELERQRLPDRRRTGRA